MRINLSRLMLAACFLLAGGSVGIAAQDHDEAYDDITSQMEEIRQLALLTPLNVTHKTGDELRQELSDSLDTDFPPEEQEITEIVLVSFGLMDPDVDIGQLQVDLYSEQVAGYYDPETGEMVVIVDDIQDDVTASDKVTFAHETVHALQDQNFDLGSFDDVRLEGTSDGSMAITALIEGDATLGMLDYLLANPDVARDYLAELNSGDISSDVLDSAPPILTATLMFPYNEGQVFVQALYDDGGWDAVDAAYSNPPTTSEQILHPEKYLDGEGAVAVELPDIAASLGAGWTTIDTDTMGEFQISILLDNGELSDQQIEKASEGWGGDSYSVATSDDGEVVVAWQSAWDSEDDAKQFAQVLAAREANRLDADADTADDVTTIESDDAVVRIVLDGDTVTYIQAPDVETLNTVADGLD